MEASKRILAIETSSQNGSVAALCGQPDGCHLTAQIAINSAERTAQVLAPTLQRLLKEVHWSPKSIELVAVVTGPGSFTGLRIGVTTAKAIAYAVGADVIGVNTLEAIAFQSTPSNAPLWAVLYAQRQELFVARFMRNEALSMNTMSEASILPQETWLAGLRAGDRVSGPALGKLIARLPAGVDVTPRESWEPMAATVGQLAWQAYQAGHRDDVWQLAPQYYRASAAEEKRPL